MHNEVLKMKAVDMMVMINDLEERIAMGEDIPGLDLKKLEETKQKCLVTIHAS